MKFDNIIGMQPRLLSKHNVIYYSVVHFVSVRVFNSSYLPFINQPHNFYPLCYLYILCPRMWQNDLYSNLVPVEDLLRWDFLYFYSCHHAVQKFFLFAGKISTGILVQHCCALSLDKIHSAEQRMCPILVQCYTSLSFLKLLNSQWLPQLLDTPPLIYAWTIVSIFSSRSNSLPLILLVKEE